MKVPFLHRNVLALDLVKEGYKWTCFSTRPGREPRVETGLIECAGAGSREDFKQLTTRLNIEEAEIVVRLNPLYVRHYLIQGPSLEASEDFDCWIQDELVQRYPDVNQLNEFISDCCVVHHDEETVVCLVALAKKSSVDREVARLQSMGIEPQVYSSLYAELEWLFRKENEENVSHYVLVLDAEDSVFICYRKGVCSAIQQLPGYSENEEYWRRTLIEILADLHTSRETGLLNIAGNEEAIRSVPHDELELLGIECRQWQSPWTSQAVDPAWVYPCSMAWACLNAGPTINFLTEEQVNTQTQRREKKQTIKLLLAGGTTLVLVLAIVLVLQFYFDKKLEISRRRLVDMDAQVQMLERTEARVTSLQKRLSQAQQFVGERTSVAEILECLGKNISENIWLEHLQLTNATGRYWRVQLQGSTLQESEIAVLLNRLENLERVGEVELVFSEKIEANRVYKNEHVKDVDIVQFEIRIDLLKDISKSSEVG